MLAYFLLFLVSYSILWLTCTRPSISPTSSFRMKRTEYNNCSNYVTNSSHKEDVPESITPSSVFLSFGESIRTCSLQHSLPNPLLVVESKTSPSFLATLHNPSEDIFISGSLFSEDASGIFMIDELEQLRQIIETTPSKSTLSNVIIDVGANIGMLTLYFASYNYTLYSFEPVPANFEKLQFSACMNKYVHNRNITPHHYIVSNVAGQLFPMVSFYNNKGHSGVLTGEKVGFNVEEMVYKSNLVNTTTLDISLMHICDPKNRPRMLKIDVEGFEGFVLDGAREFLRKCPPVYIYIELNKKFIDEHTHPPMRMLDIMYYFKELGYSLMKSPNFFNEDTGEGFMYFPKFWKNDTKIKWFVDNLDPVLNWGDYLFFKPE